MFLSKKIKLLSVNDCWQGRRFKTPAYKTYEKELLHTLPQSKLPETPLMISLVFGFSNSASDIDNPTKPLLDILQKKYGFNDKDIYKLNIEKVKVKKGDEFFAAEISTIIKPL